MASKIKVYKGTVTAGGVDGDLVSSGTGLTPVESGIIKVPTLAYAEGSWIKLAVRCDVGYLTVEEFSRHVRLAIVDSGAVDKWQLAPDDMGGPGTPEAWGAHMDILSVVNATNTIFWTRARVHQDEVPINDVTVDVSASATIGAV